ncbi:GDSL esterase/lipase At5g14450-like [Cornus florida]|uniref:GDSL esterase/lipase At5g14450-like n=1 Tax=Cornus florida TaxID=4283 RepID=UPI002899FE1E|nr:GDSL esterase/lipase At5g14450-like [Cornus florida]
MVGEEVMAAPPGDFPAIYNFGDSNSDTGGIAAAFYQIQAPSGQTFFGKPVGRASDGRLTIDFIAEHLKLPHLSAYLNSIGANFSHGTNFATGGATIKRNNESWFENTVSPFPLDIQTAQFQQFKSRTTDLYNQAEQPYRTPLTSLQQQFKYYYMSSIFFFFFFCNEINVFNAEMDCIWQTLYHEGARVFWIHNTGPIGCLPVATASVKNPKPGDLDEHGCVKSQNDIAIEFNRQLKDRVIKLRTELPEAAITYVDVYAAKYGLIINAKNQDSTGFDDPFKSCCGIHENGLSIRCGNKGMRNGMEVFGGPCAKPSTAISWDGVHYSEAANNWERGREELAMFQDHMAAAEKA